MKKIKFFLFLLLTSLTTSLVGQVSFGTAQKMNDAWKFKLQDEQASKLFQFNDSKWETVQLPHDWSVMGQLSPTLASCTGYLPGGVGWYRKTVHIPQEKKGEKGAG